MPKPSLHRLRKLVRQQGGLLPGLRAYTGQSTAAMCRDLGVSRTSVHLLASGKRREDTTRRALEAGLGLPFYSIDTLLDRQ